MIDQELSKIYKAQLTNEQFNKLSQFIYVEYGIKMPPAKKIMLQSRLQKRLRELNMNNYKDYIEYVFSKEGKQMELIHMVDSITTNKTDFFREPAHFTFLNETALPELHKNLKGSRPVKVWSAGCSSGEEPYTLAMVFSEFARLNHPFPFYIIGTDISSRILNSAHQAIYQESKVSMVPIEMKKRYMLRSKDRSKKTIRMNKEIRAKVSFSRMNFMDENYQIEENLDIVFCRNVLIYFDRQTQERVINKICSKIRTGGYFFLGHSESIATYNVPLVQVKPTVFIKT